MPITEEQMTRRDMETVVRDGHLCGSCGGRLSVAWGGSLGIDGWILRCVKDINHGTITRHDKDYEEKIRIEKESRKLDSTSLMAMDQNTMIQRVNMAKFPQELTAPDKKMLAEVAVTYGFDPLMGEVTIYQGRPYVSIDGRYRKAQETGRLDGVETRPATEQERKNWQIPEGDYFFRAEVFVRGSSRTFVGWGRVRTVETTGKGYKPTETNPQRMAEKRAEAQALRKAFHIPLPSVEDFGSPEDDPVPETHFDIEGEGKVLDRVTGTITEEPSPEISEAWDNLQSAGNRTEDEIIDMDWLRETLEKINWNDVYKWLREEFDITGAKSMREAIKKMTTEQKKRFNEEVSTRLDEYERR